MKTNSLLALLSVDPPECKELVGRGGPINRLNLTAFPFGQATNSARPCHPQAVVRR
jgi:hypothetical protein